MDERPFKRLRDGSCLRYCDGRIDGWQVRQIWPDGRYRVPTDEAILGRLLALAAAHGAGRVYRDFRALYNLADRTPHMSALEAADTLARDYGADRDEADYLFAVLYMTMVSEENKAGTVLGRRVKALAVCQVLREGMPPRAAARFSRNRPAEQLGALCEERGIPR